MKKKIAFIPIDNRPVCYCLPEQIVACNNDYEFFIPRRDFLGDLTKSANIDKILDWLKNIPQPDYIILSLDTLIYGGLVSSRRCNESLKNLKERLNILKKILQEKNAKIFAFSSIMRISNNNIAEEEKDYWAFYGKKIFDYSFNSHKAECLNENASQAKCSCISKLIPDSILEDYLQTRNRNFEINKEYLSWVEEGLIDYLIYSKDDCAEYGWNVKEAQELSKLIEYKKLTSKIITKTGADEIPLSLLGRIFAENQNIYIKMIYTQEHSKHKISKYEDISLENSVKSQLEIANLKITNDDNKADIVLFINNFDNEQGELVMNVFEKGYDKDFDLPQKPFFIADVLNANGADNKFIQTLFNKDLNENLFLGYAAWNTSANTLGSVIATALAKYCAEKFSKQKFDNLQVIRFLDDWAYQANVRLLVREIKDINHQDFLSIPLLVQKMEIYENKVFDFLKISPRKIYYSYPWQRYFEIEVSFS